MSQELSGKVVAITGAASGIGLACAKAYVEAGARVLHLRFQRLYQEEAGCIVVVVQD